MNSKNFLLNFISLIGLLFFVILAFGSEDSESSSKPQEIVYNSQWDSSVHQVEKYLKKNLKDPDSYEAIEWSAVKKLDDGSFMVRCKYRAKNSFGGYVVANQIFYLSSTGEVTNVTDFNL